MRLGAVYGGCSEHHRALLASKYAQWLADVVYLPELPEADLSECDALLIPERLHAGLLHAARPAVLQQLQDGGTVVLFGPQAVLAEHPRDWLPGLVWTHEPTNFWWWLQHDATPPVTAATPDHPLFQHVSITDATWHYHGVLTPPPEAQTVIAANNGGAVLYVDEHSTPGTLIASTLDPLYHFGAYFMPATERFLDGFLPWLRGLLP